MPTFTPKIIFFDIDDTLYHKKHGLHPSTQSALERLSEQGIILAIATGRSPAIFPQPINELIHHLGIETIIGINGQYVRHQSALLQDTAIPHEDIATLKALCRAHDVEFCLISDQKMAVSRDTERVFQSLTPIGEYHVNPNYQDQSPIYQMLMFINEEEQRQVENHALFTRYKMVRWHEVSVDVLPKTMSKALGIEQLCAKMGISPKACMAFGDGWNDVEMFETVGFSVAMGNAVEGVKQRANFITTSTSEGGIAHALAHLGLI